MTTRARDLLARAAGPALLAAGLLAPLAIHWLSGRTLVWFDTQREYAPQRWLVDEALPRLSLPLWNPFMGGGMPFLASANHGVLHPVSILVAWLGTGRGADLLIGGHVLCAGVGAGLLARDLGASRAGAAVAAFAYGTSGFVLSLAGFLNLLASAGSLPFCVAGLRRFAGDPRPAHLLLGAGGAAALALSGDAQALVIGGGLALALAWEAGGWRGAWRAVAAGTVGLLVAGVQLVPSAVHLPRTVRAADTWKPDPLVWAFEPWRIPELVVPGLLWAPDALGDPVYRELAGPGRWPTGSHPSPLAASVFVGLLPLALAAVGLRDGRRGRLLGLLALLLLWIGLGPALGADAVLGRLPLWRAFQYPEKLLGPLTLVLGLLAGLGFGVVVERRLAGWKVFLVAAALAVASSGAAWLVVSALPPDLASPAQARVLRGTWHALLAAGGLGCWLLARGRLPDAWGKVALASLVWLGVASASPAALRPGQPDARLRAPGPTLEAAAPGPRIVTPYAYEPPLEEPGLDVADEQGRGHAAMGYPAYNVRARLDSLSDYTPMASKRLWLLQQLFGARWPAAARRYATTHVVVEAPRTEEHQAVHAFATRGGTRVDQGDGPGEVWAVPHRAWASFAPEVQVVGDEEAALAATGRAFTERSPAVVIEAVGRFDAGSGRVRSIERGLESLRVEAEAEAASTLVIADAWWPGWEATLDGVGVSTFRADALVRAVRWPAGRHVLEMRYRPPEVAAGLLASALGLAVLAAWAARLRRRRAGRGGVSGGARGAGAPAPGSSAGPPGSAPPAGAPW